VKRLQKTPNKTSLKLVRPDDPQLGLLYIADRLNLLPYLKGQTLEIWKEVQVIVSSSVTTPSRGSIITGLNRLPSPAVDRFNRLANKTAVRLSIMQRQKGKDIATTAHIHPHDEKGHAVWFLWRFFFQHRGWERLKRCPQCHRWFVDETRNKKKERCSAKCTNQHWSRERRKIAKHRTAVKKRSKRRA